MKNPTENIDPMGWWAQVMAGSSASDDRRNWSQLISWSTDIVPCDGIIIWVLLGIIYGYYMDNINWYYYMGIIPMINGYTHCWYPYAEGCMVCSPTNWVIDVGQMLTDIPNMEHMGYEWIWYSGVYQLWLWHTMTMRVDYFMSLLCSITYVTIPSGYLT